MAAQPIRVLCVGDDSRHVDRIERVLDRTDGSFSVAAEPSVRDGRRRLEDGDFDCVVAAHPESGTADPAFGRALGDAGRDLPFVLVASDGGTPSVESGFAGVDTVLEPDRLDQLASRIRVAVSDRRAESGFDRERFDAVASAAGRAAIRATTRTGIEEAVCSAIRESTLYGSAWIADRDGDAGGYRLRASAGVDPESMDPLPDGIDEPSDGPESTIVTVRGGGNSGDRPPDRREDVDARWASEPVAVTPLAVDDERYGVLAVTPAEPRSFGPAERAELGELATDVAHAIRSARAREAARETNDRLRTVIDASPDAIVVTDANERVQLWNPAAEELFGWSESGVLGEANPIVPPEHREEFDDLYGGVLAGEEYAGVNVTRRTKDGEQRCFSLSTARLEDEDGDVTGAVAVFQDVTERNRRERELAASQRRYRTLAEHFPNGAVVLFGDDLEIQIARGRGLDAIEGSPEELEGCSLTERVPDAVRDRLEPRLRDALAGVSDTVEVSLGDHDYRIQTVPVENDEEVFAGLAVIQDVTEQVERERELEASRQRYRSLVEAAPDPIFVADAETGRIVEVNQQAERVTGRPREELVGLHQSKLHPPDCRGEYEALFDLHREELSSVDDSGTTVRQLAGGEDVFVVTDDGGRVPVEITSSLLETGGRRYLQGIFRDVSDRKEYERTLKALNEATQRFHQAESRAEVCEIVVDIATSVLDRTIVGVHLFDKEQGALPPVAYAIEPGEDFGEPPTVDPGSKAVWNVFATNERAIFDDVREEPGAFEPDTPMRSAILTPIDGVGVLVVGDDEVGQFDESIVELVELLAGTTSEAIHRVTREQHLREREATLERQTSRLERLDDVNRQIRRVLEATVRANSREELQTEVCERLVETDRFSFAWIAGVDSTHDRLVPEAWAGCERGYLDVFDMSIDDRPRGPPEVRAATSRETTVVEYVADRIQDEPWRQDPLARGFESAIAIPLELGDVMHGVLTIYADRPEAFDDLSRDVLVDLGPTIAYTIGSIEQRRSMLTGRVVELEFEISDERCLWKRVAERTGCEFEVLSTVPHDDDTTIAFVELEADAVDRFLEHLGTLPIVLDAQAVGDGSGDADARAVRIVLGQTSLARALVEVGGRVVGRSVSESGVRLQVEARSDVDVRTIVSLVERRYRDFRLLSRQEATRRPSSDADDSVFDGLTQRQREVLEVAYYDGYFGWPRDATAEDLADVFDVASSTLSRHLRVGQRKLLENAFSDDGR